jgi:hypothetical protein
MSTSAIRMRVQEISDSSPTGNSGSLERDTGASVNKTGISSRAEAPAPKAFPTIIVASTDESVREWFLRGLTQGNLGDKKVQVILNQKGDFKCPNSMGSIKPVAAPVATRTAVSQASKSESEKLALIVADLHKRGPARPSTVKKLSTTIGALFQKHLSDTEVSSLIEKLCVQGIVIVTGTKVSYELPSKVA